MRIGAFAKKHNITQDTVRHYLDLGLLVAEKTGRQYRFTQNDSRDLETIIELKKMNFSLSEIQKILGYQRLAGLKTKEYRKHYRSFLEDKKNELMSQQQKYEKMYNYLKYKINELEIAEGVKSKRLGMPMDSIGLLRCPKCKEPLNLLDGTIEKNMILEANIHCQCGYCAIIEDGIYIDKGAVRKRTLFGQPMPTKQEYLEKTSPKFINFFYSGMAMLTESIMYYGKEPKYIMELENCVGFFLMQHIRYLPKDCTYILIDFDKDRMMNIKNDLEDHHDHDKFLFFCCDLERLPIANGSIDIMVEFWLTRVFVSSDKKFPLEIVAPLLRQGGLMTGAYPYFHRKSKDFSSLAPEIRDYMDREKLLEKFIDLNFTELQTKDIGPIKESAPYSRDIDKKEVFQLIFTGRKK